MQDTESTWHLLACQSIAGDKDSYRKLLSEIGPFLKARTLRLAPSRELAEDMAQETLIAIHKALPTFDPSRSFIPWLAAITKYKSIDLLRQWSRHKDHEMTGEKVNQWVAETFGGEDPNDTIDEGLDDELEAAIGKLPAKQAKALKLLKIEGLTVKEAAAETGWSEASIKTSAHRAYKALAKILTAPKGP